MDVFGFKIMSFNSQTFTCGWLYQDKETGDIMLNVETAYNSYQMLHHNVYSLLWIKSNICSI